MDARSREQPVISRVYQVIISKGTKSGKDGAPFKLTYFIRVQEFWNSQQYVVCLNSTSLIPIYIMISRDDKNPLLTLRW